MVRSFGCALFYCERRGIVIHKRYIYNPKTRCLHIEDCCHHIFTNEQHLVFENEDGAYEKFGRAVRICRTCQKNRDKELRGEK